ncbi:MAG: helix-turn-helix domain-containing protein [Planctomycetes bacterium]|nr:helix-turn-helix domain-containing protein [Planctomycetota bacterium]
MSPGEAPQNRVRVFRLGRDWSQAELAGRAGISRAAVSAIEGERLVPSVATALALADALDCSVDDLFRTGRSSTGDIAEHWAWPPSSAVARYWRARVLDRTLLYPVEATPLGELPHDGLGIPTHRPPTPLAERTVVLAGCDPASGLLARLYEQVTGYRMLVFCRSSRQSLDLLKQGLVHVAGVHLGAAESPNGNAAAVHLSLAQPAQLLRVTTWDDGVAVGSRTAATSVRGLLRDRLTWVGREPGSGARQCLDELLHDRPAPRRIARDHRAVAEAIRSGWADAGVCLRLVAEEAGLRFLPIRTEAYDLCFTTALAADPRVQALIRVVQSPAFRHLMIELPGYDSRRAGELQEVAH